MKLEEEMKVYQTSSVVNTLSINLCSCETTKLRRLLLMICQGVLSKCIVVLWKQNIPVPGSQFLNTQYVCVTGPTNFWNIHHPHIQSSAEVLSGLSMWNRFLGQDLYTNIIRPLLNRFDHQPVFLLSMSSALWSVECVLVWLLCACLLRRSKRM